jgi:26S proteasome regulatory subunit N11
MEMIAMTGRKEVVVGWYHSHPGFGCWMSGVDQNTQKSFEMLHERAVAVVVDPVQSVKGKVVIDAFRLIKQQMMMMQIEPRQHTSIVGFLKKPTMQALVHGLNRQYYAMPIDTNRQNPLEEKMLLNLGLKGWVRGLRSEKYDQMTSDNEATLAKMLKLTTEYHARILEESKAKDAAAMEALDIANVGTIDPKRHILNSVDELMTANIVQCLGSMLDTVIFQ